MPKLVTEVTAGVQFSRSADENGLSDSQNRSFRVLLLYPGEPFRIQDACGVFIGDRHPVNENIFCRSFTAQYEGDSRMVVLCSFQYQSTAGSNSEEDPGQYSPDIRPANWSISSSTIEAPATQWRESLGTGDPVGGWLAPANPAGDMYDGVTRLMPITTITIEQFNPFDPTKDTQHVGKVNDAVIKIGSLTCNRRTVLFRGVSARPAVESWGNIVFRGWQTTYEFAYRPNISTYNDGIAAASPREVGWDILVPQSGFNVKAFAPPGDASDEVFGQPLKHDAGKIVSPLALPDNVTAGDKVRGMVKVHEYESGGASQSPSAQPIPLNYNGRPRSPNADPKVIVRRWQVYEEMDFRTIGSPAPLRLEGL